MNLVFDLDTETFVSSSIYSPGYRQEVTDDTKRRRENFALTVRFASNGQLCDHDLGESTSLLVTVKKAGEYNSAALAKALTFTKTGSGAGSVYSSALNLFSTAIEQLFAAVDSKEPDKIDAMLELTVWNNTRKRISKALRLTIYNCVERDDDATPETSSPAPVPVTIGTVTTGAAGSDASVTNVGTSSAAILNFTIPRGADSTVAGPKGDKGDKGDQGDASTVPGPANSLSIGTVTSGSEAAATITGTAPFQTLNLVLPTGGGGGGGGGWGDFTTQSTGFTAEIGKSYFIDTSGGSYSVNLPNATGSGKSIIFSNLGAWFMHPPAFVPAANETSTDSILGNAGIYLQFNEGTTSEWFVIIDQAAGNWAILGGLPAGASLDSL